MKKITATRSLTVSSERYQESFGRCWDVSGTELATKSDSLETGGSSGELDLSVIGTKSRMVLQMVEPLSIGRSQRAARPLACAEKQPWPLVGRDASSDPRYPRPIDATSGSAGALSVGGCSDNSSRIGMPGLRAFAIDPNYRTRVAARRPHLASVSTRAECQFEQLSSDPGDAQQPAPSGGFDRTALLERVATAMVLPGLPGRLRRGCFCRISAKTPHDRCPGVCRPGLAPAGTARHLAGRQQRPLWLDLSSRFAQPLRPPGIAGRGQPHLYPRARTLAQRFHRTLQRLTAGTHPGHSLAFSFSGPARTECDDGHLFPRTHLSQSEFSNHRSDSKTHVATHIASQLWSTSGTLACRHWRITFLRRVRPSGRITILGVKFKVGKRLAHQYVSAILYTRTMLIKIHSHGRLIKQFDFPFIGKLKL